MATTNFTSSDNLTLKLWGKAAFKDAVKQEKEKVQKDISQKKENYKKITETVEC